MTILIVVVVAFVVFIVLFANGARETLRRQHEHMDREEWKAKRGER